MTTDSLPLISIIVAIDQAGTIGDDKGIPWRIKSDLKRFRALTWGKPIVMGRTTHEHIGKTLPGRTNIVLSRNPNYRAEGCLTAGSLAEAIESAKSSWIDVPCKEIVVIGGAQVYRDALPLCERIYLTRVEGVFPGTVSFPATFAESDDWVVVDEKEYPAIPGEGAGHRYFLLERGANARAGRALTALERDRGFRVASPEIDRAGSDADARCHCIDERGAARSHA